MDTRGYHYVIEASGCDSEVLTDTHKLKQILLDAAKVGGMDVKSTYFYRFSPHGVSGMVVVSGSHISIHTWPEKGYAAVDVYTCDVNSNPEKSIEYILNSIKAEYAHITEIERGVEDEDGTYTHMIVSWDEMPSEQ